MTFILEKLCLRWPQVEHKFFVNHFIKFCGGGFSKKETTTFESWLKDTLPKRTFLHKIAYPRTQLKFYENKKLQFTKKKKSHV